MGRFRIGVVGRLILAGSIRGCLVLLLHDEAGQILSRSATTVEVGSCLTTQEMRWFGRTAISHRWHPECDQPACHNLHASEVPLETRHCGKRPLFADARPGGYAAGWFTSLSEAAMKKFVVLLAMA